MTTERSTGLPGASLLIETLLPGAEPTVLTDHGVPRAWAPLPRIGGTRATTGRVRAIVTAVYHSARPVNVVLGPRNTHRFRVAATPVIGPSGAVHAVQLWTGPPDTDPPRPANVAAIEWSATSRLIELAAEIRDPAEDYPFTGRASLTAPEAFRHVARFDAAMSLIAKVLEPAPEDRWEGTATVNGPRTLRTVHLAMRSMPAPHQQAWRGLIHDVTDTVPPAQPTLDSVALAAMSAGRSPTAVALMDVSQARLISWFTDPVPGIQWKGTQDDRDTPTPTTSFALPGNATPPRRQRDERRGPRGASASPRGRLDRHRRPYHRHPHYRTDDGPRRDDPRRQHPRRSNPGTTPRPRLRAPNRWVRKVPGRALPSSPDTLYADTIARMFEHMARQCTR